MNRRLLHWDKTISLSACRAPEVYTNRFSFESGKLTACTLFPSFTSQAFHTDSEFHITEFTGALALQYAKQISIQDFAQGEVQSGFTLSTLTPAKAFYILRAGVNNLLNS